MKVMSIPLLRRLGCILLSDGLNIFITCLQLPDMLSLRMLPQNILRCKELPVEAIDTGPGLRGFGLFPLMLNPANAEIRLCLGWKYI